MADKGISGLALTLATVGGIIAYSGLKGVSVSAATRNLLSGKPPGDNTPQDFAIAKGFAFSPGGTPDHLAFGGSVTTSGVVATAMKYIGVPYNWGHATPAGWDCSGFVNWVLGHDLKMTLPGGVKNFQGKWHGPVAAQYFMWSGVHTVPRNECQPGDLCCWLTHVGIAVDRDRMVNAYTTGQPTAVTGIESNGPRGEVLRIRRLN